MRSLIGLVLLVGCLLGATGTVSAQPHKDAGNGHSEWNVANSGDAWVETDGLNQRAAQAIGFAEDAQAITQMAMNSGSGSMQGRINIARNALISNTFLTQSQKDTYNTELDALESTAAMLQSDWSFYLSEITYATLMQEGIAFQLVGIAAETMQERFDAYDSACQMFVAAILDADEHNAICVALRAAANVIKDRANEIASATN